MPRARRLETTFAPCKLLEPGDVSERPKVQHSKCCLVKANVGSNPTVSAIEPALTCKVGAGFALSCTVYPARFLGSGIHPETTASPRRLSPSGPPPGRLR